MDRDLSIADTKQKILNTFKYYTQGPSVPSDGNCGLHAICKALGDGLYMTGNKIKPNSLMLNIFYMFGLKNLPNYWWSDEELAVIANDFGYDMYIYNETDRTGIVFGKGIRPPLVLYSVNNNSHWIPGMRTVVPSSSIPENFTIIENISEVLSIRQIKIKINGHLLMRSLNPLGGCIESYGGRRDGSRSSSHGRRAKSSSRRYNGSRSVGRDEGKDGSHRGRNNMTSNKRRDDSRSGGRDVVRIVRLDGRRTQLEKGHSREVKRNNSAEEKESYNGGKIGSHSGGEKGRNSEGEKKSKREREKSISRKSDEKLLMPYSPTVNGDCSYFIDAVKPKLSLYAKLKNTMLSKMVRQLYHWNWNEKNKYKKLDFFDTEDESDYSEDTELNAIYNDRYTIMRDMLHHFVSKNERKLLIVEACDALFALQSLEPTMTQLEPIKCPELEPVKIECHMEDVNCYPIVAVENCPIETVECCSFGAIDCSSDVAVYCPYKKSECPFILTNCPCNIDGCPFTVPEYPFSDQWVSEKYVNNSFDSYALKRNKIKGTRLFNRFYNQAVAMSNNIIVRCIVKPKRAVVAPPAVASVLVAPAMVVSVVTASVVASPAMAAWMVAAPGLSSSVMQVAPAVAVLAMVVPEVAAPTMAIAVEVALSDNDLVTVPADIGLLATPMENILTMASVGSDSVVKSKAFIKRYFSLRKIWKKKSKTQHSKGH